MSRASVTSRGWRLLALTCVIAALVVSILALGLAHTVIIVAVVLGIAVVTFAGTEWVLRGRLRGHAASLPAQFAIAIGLVVAPVLAALVILGLAMFVAGADAALVGVIIALSGVLGIAAARRLTRALSADVGLIRDGLAAVGEGERPPALTAMSAPELRELAEQASAMISALKREESGRAASEEARRQLIAHASHDLRTPVTALRLLAGAIDDDVVDGELRREYVSRMLTHIDALSALIDDLFELSRIQAGDINWTFGMVALDDLVADTVAAMQAEATARGVTVSAELPDGLVMARANAERLQRVLFNLIQNAIRHSPAEGSVVVRAETVGQRVEIEVEDHGEGIPPDVQQFVFDPFYRGDSGNGELSGSAGLGLAVAAAIIDAHDGEIWLPRTEAGTRVRFSLPIAAPA